MQTIKRRELKRLMHDRPDGFYLVDVLNESFFHDFHLPGAINIPLEKSADSEPFVDRVRKAIPDTSAKIVLYCQNMHCDASARGAADLLNAGYKNIHRYEEGKEGWRDAGLAIEHGHESGVSRKSA